MTYAQQDVPLHDGRRVGPDRHDARPITITTTTRLIGGLFNAPFVDARRSALNTNDLRGKITADQGQDGRHHRRREEQRSAARYTVPAGNLFPPSGTAPRLAPRSTRWASATRSGSRSTRTTSPTSATTRPTPTRPQQFRGPAGTGRFEIVREPANYGWPICYKTDLAATTSWDFNTSTPLERPARPPLRLRRRRRSTNDSRWNVERRPDGRAWPDQPPADHEPRDLVLVPGQPAARTRWGPRASATTGRTPCDPPAPGSTTPCPRLFPELYTGGVGPHGIAKYDYDAGNPNTDQVPALLRRRRSSWASSPRTRCARSGSTRRTASSRSTSSSTAAPSARVRRRARSSATTRWTCSWAPTATSTCSRTATGSSPPTPTRACTAGSTSRASAPRSPSSPPRRRTARSR